MLTPWHPCYDEFHLNKYEHEGAQEGVCVPEQHVVLLTVKKDEHSALTPALFSNFLQISRVATEVQFEFVFVDVSDLAQALQKAKESEPGKDCVVHGRTVAKVVLPALNFMQVKEHIYGILNAVEQELGKLPDSKEVQDGGGSVVAR